MSNEATTPAAGAPASDEIDGVGIRVGGALVAWFLEPAAAEEWARENHFGQWLAHPCKMPNRPPFTQEQIAEAEREGAKLAAHFGIGRTLDD